MGRSILRLAGILSAISTPVLAQSHDKVNLRGRVMDPEAGFDQIANADLNNG